jgi:DNA-binding GntR family transcriptional regulator
MSVIKPGLGSAQQRNGERPLLGRTILREQVRDVLLERIMSGHYAPGSRLVETRIAEELGVSQAPVREALRDLEQLRLVVHESFRGCSVRDVSAADLLEAYPVRAALEGLAARLAAEHIEDEDLAALERLIDAMRQAGADGDAAAETAADAEFHATIVRAANNAVLTAQWEQLLPHARTFISLTLPASAHGDLADRHVSILQALRRRDPRLAEASMHEHLADVAERMQALITTSNQEETP